MKKLGIVILCMIVLLLSSCTKPPIKVAFVGGLTGDMADLGICARNTFLMEVEKINEQGGINGRELEVIVFDDANDSDRLADVYVEIRQEEIEFVVGHIVSSMAESVIVEASKEDVLIISGTISTTKAKGIDDYFVRTSPTTDEQSITLVNEFKADGIEDLLIVNDVRNLQFVEDISSKISENNGINTTIMKYVPYEDHESFIIEEMKEKNFDGLLLSVPAEEAAYISQMVKQVDPSVKLYGISWARDEILIEAGGEAVEGMKFTYRYTEPENQALITDFYKEYEEKYGEPSMFIGELTHDVSNAFMSALESAEEISAEGVRLALLNNQFSGLTSDFTIDEYGDREGGYGIFIVENGAYRLLDER